MIIADKLLHAGMEYVEAITAALFVIAKDWEKTEQLTSRGLVK